MASDMLSQKIRPPRRFAERDLCDRHAAHQQQHAAPRKAGGHHHGLARAGSRRRNYRFRAGRDSGAATGRVSSHFNGLTDCCHDEPLLARDVVTLRYAPSGFSYDAAGRVVDLALFARSGQPLYHSEPANECRGRAGGQAAADCQPRAA